MHPKIKQLLTDKQNQQRANLINIAREDVQHETRYLTLAKTRIAKVELCDGRHSWKETGTLYGSISFSCRNCGELGTIDKDDLLTLLDECE